MVGTTHKPGERSGVEPPYPPLKYAWYVIGVLFVATLLSQLDRQLPALLVKPIRAEFGISDTPVSYTHLTLPTKRIV